LDVDAEKTIHIVKKGNGDYLYDFRPVVFVTALEKASKKFINALHVVIEGDDKAASNLALLTGDAIRASL